MGKEREKLLWSLGKKPSTISNEEAYRQELERRVEEGDLPPRMKQILEQAHGKEFVEEGSQTLKAQNKENQNDEN